jgi:hypothetical protein
MAYWRKYWKATWGETTAKARHAAAICPRSGTRVSRACPVHANSSR